MSVTILNGDCLDVMAALEPASIDAVVTDPPYGYSFMSATWDHGVPGVPYWQAVHRVLKPGANMLSFGGTRTYHRLTCAIEDAGFEIRDCLMWLYGSGFPKGKGCLKPGWEPIVLARKPGPSPWLNIDGCRLEGIKNVPASPRKTGNSGYGGYAPEDGTGSGHDPNVGRWPANVVLDEEAAALLDEQSGELKAGVAVRRHVGKSGGNFPFGAANADMRDDVTYGDTGGASRFFYVAKASTVERGQGNDHPTVKPLALMSWLVKLVTPPGGTVLDPFAGSGSTLIAADRLGFDCIGIERDPHHVETARRRLESDAGMFADVIAARPSEPRQQALMLAGGEGIAS